MESTRRHALEEILRLAVESDHLRELFRLLGADNTIRKAEPFIWDHCIDESMQYSSRSALLYFGDRQFFRAIQDCKWGEEEEEANLINYIQ